MVKNSPDKKSGSDSRRVSTGIQGLDELIAGGLLRNHTYMISSNKRSGSVLTETEVFGLQFIYQGIMRYGENAIYITDERNSRIREYVQKFGWDFEELENEGKLAILDSCGMKIVLPSQEKKNVDVKPFDLRSMMDWIIAVQDTIDAKRAFLDWTTPIEFYFQDPSKMRRDLLVLSETLKVLGLTSLFRFDILDENMPDISRVETFPGDGIILMYDEDWCNLRGRSIEIYTMRGSDHSHKSHPYEMTSDGIIVHPRE